MGVQAKRPAWRMGRAAYYADFFLIPLMAVAIAWTQLRGFDRYVAAGLICGYLLWTIAEYAIHRFLFHRLLRREHFAHHARPADYIGVGPWLTLLAFLGASAGLIELFGPTFGAGAAIGLLCGYFTYIFVHDRIHHEAGSKHARSLYRRPRAAHALHHRGIEANFGVVHPLWDHVFRTWRAP